MSKDIASIVIIGLLIYIAIMVTPGLHSKFKPNDGLKARNGAIASQPEKEPRGNKPKLGSAPTNEVELTDKQRRTSESNIDGLSYRDEWMEERKKGFRLLNGNNTVRIVSTIQIPEKPGFIMPIDLGNGQGWVISAQWFDEEYYKYSCDQAYLRNGEFIYSTDHTEDITGLLAIEEERFLVRIKDKKSGRVFGRWVPRLEKGYNYTETEDEP